MKNNTIVIVLAAYLLFIAAQVRWTGAMPAGAAPAAEPAVEEPVYQLEEASSSRTVRSGDKRDRELAEYTYQILTLSAVDVDGLSAPEAETVRRNVETFNDRMYGLLEEFEDQGREMAVIARSAYAEGSLSAPYYDTVAASGVITGEVVSIRIDRSGYTGGAHPNSYVSGYLFDLETGQFIPSASQLADDPAAFHTGISALLIEEAENGGNAKDQSWGYWDDYQDIIRGESGVTVFDETGMTVVYAPYELGCYAIGTVELHLDWEELADLLGPGGLEKLGAAPEK